MSKNSDSKNQTSDKNQNTTFDLEERMSDFGVEIVHFCKNIKQDVITRPLINQIIRSATSIGANYCEANNASSKKDFRNKAYIAKKEAEETKHWIKMLNAASPENKVKLRILWQECHELVLILQSIINKVNSDTSGK